MKCLPPGGVIALPQCLDVLVEFSQVEHVLSLVAGVAGGQAENLTDWSG
jgi:hypothetical protein